MKRARNEEGWRKDERASTELVGFVLVFGTVVLGIATVSLAGFQVVQLEQDHRQVHHTDRALDGLSNDFDDILRIDGVSQRDHELAGGGGTIAPGEPGPQMEVAVDHADGTDTESWHLGSFGYEGGSHAVAYEGGGVFRTDESGEQTVLTEPRVRCTDETAIISVVTIEEDGRSIQSDGIVSITATETKSYRETFSDISSFEVGIETDRTSDRGWERVFADGWTETGDRWTCLDSDGPVVDSVTVHVVTIDIDYAPSR